MKEDTTMALDGSKVATAEPTKAGEQDDFLSGVEAQEVDWEAQVCIGCD